MPHKVLGAGVATKMIFLGRGWYSVGERGRYAMSRLLRRGMGREFVRMRSHWLAWLNTHISVADEVSLERMFTIFGGSKSPEEIQAIVM